MFALKGNYDEGFGRAQHKEKWLPGGKKVAGEPAAASPVASAAPADAASPAAAADAAAPAAAAADAAAAPAAAAAEPKSPVEEKLRSLEIAPPSPSGPPAEVLSPTVVKYQLENKDKLKGMPIKLSGLTLDDVEAAQKEFKRVNASGSGAITEDEFLVLIEEVMEKKGKVMGRIVLKTTSKALFQAYDTDKNGVIDEAEFLQIYSDLLLDKEKREKAGEKAEADKA